jgi:hypothetical protein
MYILQQDEYKWLLKEEVKHVFQDIRSILLVNCFTFDT